VLNLREEGEGDYKMVLGINKWWNQMKDTYGDNPHAFKQGIVDGKLLTVQAKYKRKEIRADRKAERKRQRKLRRQK